ncbi:hypothetical protein Hanom_Chr07g00610351 [Helianthus anomalus]
MDFAKILKHTHRSLSGEDGCRETYRRNHVIIKHHRHQHHHLQPLRHHHPHQSRMSP